MKTQMKPLTWFLTLLALVSAPHLASAYYDPGVQRWINRDRMEEFAGYTLYTFSDGNPVTFVDPSGQQATTFPPPPSPPPIPPVQVPLPKGSTYNCPSGCGAGNGPVARPPPNPVKYKPCSMAESGWKRNSSNDTEACPCSGAVVNCIKFETCEPVLTRVGTEPMPPTNYWVPHRKCGACPEGHYGNS